MKFPLMIVMMVLGVVAAVPVRAADTQPGAACAQAGLLRMTGGADEAVARTLICDGTVWQVADEHSNVGKTLLQIGNDTGDCTADKQGRLRFDGLNVEICNGTLWSELVAGSGSGGLRYAGLTTATYNGNMGRMKGVAEKCHAEFPNSRMMSSDDIIKLARDITSVEGWVDCATYGGAGACASSPNYVNSGASSISCSAWGSQTDNGNFQGLTYNGSNLSYAICSSAYRIHCVFD